jgi:transcriptional regulator with PAS, ATPase and Fis domain
VSESNVVIVGNGSPHDPGAGCERVASREEAFDRLSREGVRAICFDLSSVDDTLRDIRWLRRRRCRVPLLAVVEPLDVHRGVEILAAGAAEILLRDPELGTSLRGRLEMVERRRARRAGPEPPAGIVAVSVSMRKCLGLVERAARSDATVLLEGETGSGKEVLARLIHTSSRRKSRPFVAINCAAFPETLLESELFGYERGAFTGAVRSKPGHFVEAEGGTLFLDEIAETSLAFQAKLLRALQEETIRPLGSTREVPLDVRIVAATNRDLLHEAESGRFRRDLYYRLHVLPVSVPSLRSRPEDVLPLSRHFLARAAANGGPERIGPDAVRLLETYPWPGNVRELENEIARVVANSVGEPEITARMLSPRLQGLGAAIPPDPGGETLRESIARLEAWILRRALEKHDGRRIATARALGITRECLYKKLKRYGMQ